MRGHSENKIPIEIILFNFDWECFGTLSQTVRDFIKLAFNERMEKIAILAITKNGIKIAKELKEKFSSWEIFVPNKFSDDNTSINWYNDNTSTKIVELFKSNDALVCLFSLGAVIRLISPHLKDKKTDPAVIVIDDKAQFVISTLSGHLGGANKLTNDIADRLGATPVITTAADVNKTIAVDLVGKDFGWKIDDDSNVTKISAFMVNEEKIGVYQNCGRKDWWGDKLPSQCYCISYNQ